MKPATPTPAPRSWLSLLGRFGRHLLVLYAIVVGLMMFFENSLVYQPSKYPKGNWRPTGLQFEDANFASADGTALHGWYVPHAPESLPPHAAEPLPPRAVVLFCHGNGGNITHRAYTAAGLRRLGCTVLLFDYRGYGRAEGQPNEAGILADARAARRWLADKCSINESEIVLMGESLGGGVAVDLATDGARGLILQSTFASLPDAASKNYGWLPVRWIMRNRLDSISKIGDYHGPLLQLHGDADWIVAYDSGRRLFDAANDPKRFVTIAGGGHNDLPEGDFWAAVDAFLKTL